MNSHLMAYVAQQYGLHAVKQRPEREWIGFIRNRPIKTNNGSKEKKEVTDTVQIAFVHTVESNCTITMLAKQVALTIQA